MISMPRFLRLILASALLIASGAVVAQADDADKLTATEVVEGLHAELLQSMKNAKELGYAGRFQQLKPVIERSFAIPMLAKSTVRGYWDKFTPTQQEQFIANFRHLTIDTYAQLFDGFDGESFEILEEKEIARGNRQVNAQLVKADGEKISLVYVLTPDANSWQVVNVVAQGVSDLALKRSQYVGVLKKQGVDAFLTRFNDQIEALPDPTFKGSE